MTEEEKWEELLRSMRKAARILGMTLEEDDLPEYLNWFSGAKMHQNLWDQVYLQNQRV